MRRGRNVERRALKAQECSICKVEREDLLTVQWTATQRKNAKEAHLRVENGDLFSPPKYFMVKFLFIFFAIFHIPLTKKVYFYSIIFHFFIQHVAFFKILFSKNR